MEPLQYIIWTSLSLTLFYGVYQLFFREDTPAWAHRFYLIFTIICSLAIPFQPFALPAGFNSSTLSGNINDLGALEVLTTTSAPQEISSISFWDILGLVYLTILSLMLLRLLWQFIKLGKLYRTATLYRKDNLHLVLHPSVKAPFSFFKLVFIPEELLKEDRFEQVVTHEKIHANQLHSLDILLAECLIALLWFHPAAWLIKNKFILIHEYLADDGVLQTGVDKNAYQVLLLNQIAEGRLICLSSNFNHSLIKKRIVMMSKIKVKTRSSLKLLALIPVTLAMALAVACANPEEPVSTADELNIPPPPPPVALKDLNPEEVTFWVNGKQVTKAYVDELDPKIINTVNITKDEDGNKVIINTKDRKIAKKVSYELAKKLFVVNGIAQEEGFDINTIGKENIKTVDIVDDPALVAKYSDKHYDGVVMITTK